MSRVNRTTWALAVALAALLVAVSAARAAGPEYFTCVKMRNGNWSANCEVQETPGQGSAERESAVGVTYSSKSGTAVLSTPAIGGKVTCKKSTGAGTITGPQTDEDTVTFSGCSSEGKPCESAGERSGEIKTNTLETTLVEREPGTAYVQFAAAGGPEGFQAEYECSGVLLRTKGFTDALITNSGNKKTELAFAGEENLLTEVNVGDGFIGPFPSEENADVTDKDSKPLEVTDVPAGPPCHGNQKGALRLDANVGAVEVGKDVTITYMLECSTIAVKWESITVNDGSGREKFFRLLHDTDKCSNASFAPGVSCSFAVEFTPAEVKKYSATLTITYSKVGGKPAFPLKGTLDGEGKAAK